MGEIQQQTCEQTVPASNSNLEKPIKWLTMLVSRTQAALRALLPTRTEDQDDRIVRRCVDLIFAQNATAYSASIFCGVMIYVVFWVNSNFYLLNAWAGAYLGMILIRQYHKTQYEREGEAADLSPWLTRLYLTHFVSGCLWGAMCAYLTAIASTSQLLLVFLIIAGLLTGSVLSYSFRIHIFALFSVPLILPTSVMLLSREEPLLPVMAGVMVVWYLFLFLCAVRFERFYTGSLQLAFQNVDMAKNLSGQNKRVFELNEDLEEKISALNETKNALLEEKRHTQSLVEELKELSVKDPLTNIPNRRKFNESLSREWSRAIRYQTPLSLILCDLDHFKKYNDYYGHQKGDECLIQIARTIDKIARRAGDFAARYGGEEFAIILSDTASEQAAQLAEGARQAIIALDVPHRSVLERQVTMSFGVATLVPTQQDQPEDLFNAADQALYFAKARGRNRVRVYDEDNSLMQTTLCLFD